MTEKKFSFEEAIRFGWDTFKANVGFFIGLLLLAFVIQTIPSALSDVFKETNRFLYFLFSLVSIFFQFLVTIGLLSTALRFCDHQPVQVSDLWAYPHLFLRFFGATILCSLAVMGGFILLIIPGIILGIRLQFFSYLIVDRNFPVMESLKTSFAMTKGATWDLFVFGLLLTLINLAGALCLVVGLFVSLPVTMLAGAFVYRKFLTFADNVPVVKSA